MTNSPEFYSTVVPKPPTLAEKAIEREELRELINLAKINNKTATEVVAGIRSLRTICLSTYLVILVYFLGQVVGNI